MAGNKSPAATPSFVASGAFVFWSMSDIRRQSKTRPQRRKTPGTRARGSEQQHSKKCASMTLCVYTISSPVTPGKLFATRTNTAFTSHHLKNHVVCPSVVQLSACFHKWLIMNYYEQFARESYTLWRLSRCLIYATAT